MFIFETKIQVRYAETDQMGYVYYGNYATYYEVGRVEMLRSLGASYKSLEDTGIMLPVLEMQTRFIKPARYDEELTVKVYMKEIPAVRIRFEYELFGEDGELINTGNTTLAFIDKNRYKPCKPPQDFIDRLLPYFE